jgi:hypothetical protein
MALSRRAALHAAEIKLHDWSDAPYRADKAGHNRDMDGRSRTQTTLTQTETDCIRLNVMWVTAQVLAYDDPNFDVYEFAEACGVNTLTTRGERNGGIVYGLRRSEGGYCRPGTYCASPR